MSRLEDTVEFSKKEKRNDEKEGKDQVLCFPELKSHFDKKLEAINKIFSVEIKHLAKPGFQKSQWFHPLIIKAI